MAGKTQPQTVQPDAILRELREAIKAWETATTWSREEWEAAERATSAAAAIDNFLSHGGVLPKAWRSAKREK